MHALVIEDHPLVAMHIEAQLSDLGYTTFDVATSEAAAVGAAQARCPDLVTAEDRLASGSGIDAVRAVCAGRSIAVVYILSVPDAARPRLPADAALTGKPFTSDALREAVSRATRLVTGAS